MPLKLASNGLFKVEDVDVPSSLKSLFSISLTTCDNGRLELVELARSPSLSQLILSEISPIKYPLN